METTERTALNAGPDYWWFVDPEYANVDRLAEDECPMDAIHEAADHEAEEREAARERAERFDAFMASRVGRPSFIGGIE